MPTELTSKTRNGVIEKEQNVKYGVWSQRTVSRDTIQRRRDQTMVEALLGKSIGELPG